MSMIQAFIQNVYADHNDSQQVKEAIAVLLTEQRPGAEMLNVGGGQTRLAPGMKTLEIAPGPGIDIVGSVLDLPMADNSIDLIVTQEVLEHVRDPVRAMSEIHRVLKPGAKAFVQLPFVIGDHRCPDDYWRFTEQGIVELARLGGFKKIKRGVTVGPAVGYYRISVEFFAVLFSLLAPRSLYKPMKGIAALVLYPMKWLDKILLNHPEMHRIAGGFFIVVTK